MKYREYNDFELLSFVCEQNEEANEILYEKYKPLITQISNIYNNRYGYLGIDINDLISEGMLGLSIALNTFDEVKDNTFYSYAKVCIERNINTFIKKIKGLKYKYLNESVSYDNTNDDYSIENVISDNTYNPLYSMINDENIGEVYTYLKSILTDLEYKVLRLKVDGLNYKEIASILNTNPKNIDNALYRIKDKLRR